MAKMNLFILCIFILAAAAMFGNCCDVVAGNAAELIIKPEGHTDCVNSAVFSPDGKTILTASLDGTVLIWDAATGKELHKLESMELRFAMFSPDGKTVVTASWSSNARIWNAVTGKELRKLDDEHTPLNFSHDGKFFSPDSKFVITADFDKTATIWDTATGKESQKLEGHTKRIFSAEFSPDNKTAATASEDNTIRIWKLNTIIEK
jgi:WD40 repeat protein